MPNSSSIPIFVGEGVARRMREEFERYRCRDIQLPVNHDELPDVCKRHIFSISAIMQQQALGTVACQAPPPPPRTAHTHTHGEEAAAAGQVLT